MNPRYLAYVRSQGMTTEESRAADETMYPGGRMTGFVLWLSLKWQAWDAMHKHPTHHVRDAKEHAEFDEWIGATGCAK